MASSIEEEIKTEIKKTEVWYGKTYKKNLEVHFRYDRQDRHFSWRIIANIGNKDRMISIGISEKAALKMQETAVWDTMLSRLADNIKQSLIKAQVKYEPHILALK